MDIYREQILDLYKNPKNRGKMGNPTVAYEEYNPLCGDKIFLQLLIEGGKIVDVKFSGEGCAISTAAASLLSDYIKGKDLANIRKIKADDILQLLGLESLTPARLKCALLPLEGLRHTLSRYQEGNNYGKA